MARTVEVICVGSDFEPELDRAAAALNAAQQDFVFRVAPEERRNVLKRYSLRDYQLAPTLRELIGYYNKHLPGETLTVVGVVESPLEGNIFGAHARDPKRGEADFGVFTTYGFARYTDSLHAFLCFYLTKFAVQSLAPELKGHPEYRKCVFDERNDKRNLIPVLNDPDLCDDCRTKLQPALESGITLKSVMDLLNVVKTAANAICVSTLIMKGGGVKGMALAGSLSILMRDRYKPFYRPTTFVGASAGALIAAFLSAGLSADDLREQLKQDFSEFLDPWCRVPENLLSGGGFHSGDPIVSWLDRILCDRFKCTRDPNDSVRFEEVAATGFRLLVYAANRFGSVTFDSRNAGIMFVSKAIRFSMSIPLFFTTKKHADEEMFDGGLLNNYPVQIFLRDNPDFKGEFLALFLSDGRSRPNFFLPLRIISILLNRDEILDIRKYNLNTLVIDCSPVRTTEFSLSEKEKNLLWDRGRRVALAKVIERGWDESAETAKELTDLERQLANDLLEVKALRRSRFWRRLALNLLATASAAIFAWGLVAWTGSLWSPVVVALVLYVICRIATQIQLAR